MSSGLDRLRKRSVLHAAKSLQLPYDRRMLQGPATVFAARDRSGQSILGDGQKNVRVRFLWSLHRDLQMIAGFPLH